MPVRVADSIKQQNNLTSFPVAYGEDIWLDKNKGDGEKEYKSIQSLFNDDELGGGGSGMPEPESSDKIMISSENETSGNLGWEQKNVTDVVNSALQKRTIVKTFSGTIKTSGFVTNSGKDYYYTINVPCANIKKIILNNISITVRENNAYIIGSASSGADVTTQTRASTYGDGFISLVTQLSSAPSSVINNSPFGIQCAFNVTVEYTNEVVCMAVNEISDVLSQLEPVIDYKVYTAKTELNNSINGINAKLGTQVTYSLNGSTLTITTK